MKKIGIIAPSGCAENFDENKVRSFFDRFGKDTVIFPSCFLKYRYMAGEDKIRLEDIHSAFLDKTIDTIICLRGGYGAIRLLDEIDYELISKNKKNFVGFSDITSLLISFYKNSGLKGFHGKMVLNGILNMDEKEFLQYVNSIENPVFKTELTGGILWGGNLATIVSLFGSKEETYIPNEDIILFIEDINEADYKIDKMCNQILRNEKLASKIKGIIFGDFIGAGKYLEEIQCEFAAKLGVPFETNLNVGHGVNNVIVPFGHKV